ncbi:MAG: DUF1385 domain-containing protein [Lachnospiraceae bacterium]|nr:DUF1385 domain-containing protein [Lachnospiraceae bacterium]
MKYSNIGGQAVMEGVMMRNGSKYAVAVRTQTGKIEVVEKTYNSLLVAEKVKNIPILRGVVSFVDSLVLGMTSLMLSADFFAEETPEELEERLTKELAKAEKKAKALEAKGKSEEAAGILEEARAKADKERHDLELQQAGQAPEKEKEDNSLLMGLTVAFSVVCTIGLFILLPYFLSRFLHTFISNNLIIVIAEALLRMAIFLGYLAVISMMKEIQRTYMYHGAEHKCINCIEHGLELNVENVRKSSRLHKRCGTSFLLIVMIVSVITFMIIRIDSPLWRVLIRILLMPVIAGVSFEFIRLAGRYDNKLVDILSAPGLCLQKLTTKEPDDAQIEVGIASVEAIFDWKKYLNENFDAHYDLSE